MGQAAKEERRARSCGAEPVVRHHVPGPRGRLGQAQLQVGRRGRTGGAGVKGEAGSGNWEAGGAVRRRSFVRAEGEAGAGQAAAEARR